MYAPQGTSLLDQFVNAKNPLYKKIGEEKLVPYLDEMPLVNKLEIIYDSQLRKLSSSP